MLSTEKSFEMFPRHNGLATISESFALDLWITVPNNCLPHYNAMLNKIFNFFQ